MRAVYRAGGGKGARGGGGGNLKSEREKVREKKMIEKKVR